MCKTYFFLGLSKFQKLILYIIYFINIKIYYICGAHIVPSNITDWTGRQIVRIADGFVLNAIQSFYGCWHFLFHHSRSHLALCNTQPGM